MFTKEKERKQHLPVGESEFFLTSTKLDDKFRYPYMELKKPS
jgi:hypothetical protein